MVLNCFSWRPGITVRCICVFVPSLETLVKTLAENLTKNIVKNVLNMWFKVSVPTVVPYVYPLKTSQNTTQIPPTYFPKHPQMFRGWVVYLALEWD